VPKDAEYSEIKWNALYCVYGGWKNLIDGSSTIAMAEIDEWHKRWQLTEGDVAVPDRAFAPEDLALADPIPFFPTDLTPAFAYEATAKDFDLPAPIGFSLPTLLGSVTPRPSWTTETYDQADLRREVLQVPPIPDDPKPGRYVGGPVDLDTLKTQKMDLTAFLKSQPNLADRVVLRLTGTGHHDFKPIHLKNVHLVIYFDRPKDAARPLVLVPAPGPLEEHQQGFIEITSGRLDLINANIAVQEGKPQEISHYLICVTSGELHIQGCRLHGPWLQATENFRGLIGIEGAGAPEGGKAVRPSVCQIHDSIIECGKSCLQIWSIGSRLRIDDSVLLSLQNGINLTPWGKSNWLNTYCVLDHVTLAAWGHALFLDEAHNALLSDPPPFELVMQPITLQSHACAFLNPFPGTEGKPGLAGLLGYGGSALTHGVLVWQSEGDVYDKRLQYAAARDKGSGSATVAEATPQALTRLWGRVGNRQANHTLALSAILDFKASPRHLDTLMLPDDPSLRELHPGANFVNLGIKK
jgi:hypothetical protein